jgi:4-hydroxy-tetrahydrodipicolinate synthase
MWPVMLTPFNEDKSINYNQYEDLVNYYIDHSAAGLFASCGSSEMDMLSEDELFNLAARAVEYADGRVPVVGGAIIVDNLDRQIGMVKRMAQSGVDTVVIGMSQFAAPKESEDLIISRIDTLLDRTEGIRLGLYECPHPYRRTFSPEKYQYLVNTGRFFFHKDTCCDEADIEAKLEKTRGSDVTFLNAHLPTLPCSLAAGGDGYCGVVTNFFPDLLSHICSHYFETGRIEQEIMDYILSEIDVVRNKYPRSAKMFIRLNAGILDHYCRSDAELFTKEEIEGIGEAVEGYRAVSYSISALN